MTLDPRKTTLLVIDVQNEYFDGKWPVPDGTTALDQIERAIDASQQANATVVYVQHAVLDRKSTRLNSSHIQKSRMPSSA